MTNTPIVAQLFVDPTKQHVKVGDIAELTARAVHPHGGIEWAAALEYHKRELDAAISRGEIHGFEPLTMRPLTDQLINLPPKGSPLANAWVPLDDVRNFASRVGVNVTFDFSEMKYRFGLDLRKAIADQSHWSERELEALCLGVPPNEYYGECAPEAERNSIRQAIVDACKSGKVIAEEAGTGNAIYGGSWIIERVSAVRWAVRSRLVRFPEWLARSCLPEIYALQDEERRTEGRYTLREAAEVLEEHTGTSAKDWLEKFELAVRVEQLLVYRPGEQARYCPKNVRADYDEAYWDDLNKWLRTYERRVKFQFDESHTREATNVTTRTASAVELCPNKFSLYWLNRQVDADLSFGAQAMAVLEKMKEHRPAILHETTTPASSGGALINEWLVNRDLPCFMRGRQIDDFAALTVHSEGDLAEAIAILESQIYLNRDDVIRLLAQQGMSVPGFLMSSSCVDKSATLVDARQLKAPAGRIRPARTADVPVSQLADGAKVASTTPNVTSHSLRHRGDLMKPVIQRIVEAEVSYDPNVVFPRLRAMALNEEDPLNGVAKNGDLLWTDADGKKRLLNKRALAERLRTMRRQAKAG